MVKKIKIMVRNVQDVGIRYWWKFCIIYGWLSCWERKMNWVCYWIWILIPTGNSDCEWYGFPQNIFILLKFVQSQTLGITWVFINSKSVRSLFFIFVFWIVFIVSWLELVVWSRKIYLIPVEIASFWFLVSFKGRGRRVSPRFNLFVSNIIQGNEERGWVEDLLLWKDFP